MFWSSVTDKMMFIRLVTAVAVNLSLFSFGAAQINPINHALDKLLENFIVLDLEAIATQTAATNAPVLAFDESFRLQAPNVTAEKYASYRSEAVAVSLPLWESDFVNAGLNLGLRGTFNVNGGFFTGGLAADNGVLGMTPTLGGNMWLGTETFGVLFETHFGDFGKKNGMLGSITPSWNVMDAVPKPYLRDFSGFSEVLLGVSASFMDREFSRSHGVLNPDGSAIALRSISTGIETIYDLGEGFRVSVPIGWDYVPLSAADPFGSNTQDWRLGVSFGYRYE